LVSACETGTTAVDDELDELDELDEFGGTLAAWLVDELVELVEVLT
jgi:hypothetical protein